MNGKRFLNKSFVMVVIAGMLLSAMVAGRVSYAKIKMNKKTVILSVGSRARLKLKGTKKKPKWSTSNAKVVDVYGNGNLIGMSVGKAVVTAKLKKKKYFCSVTVSEDDPGSGTGGTPVNTTTPVATIAPVATNPPAATSTPSGGRTETYSKVSSGGETLSVKPGFTRVTYRREVKDASTGIKVRIPSIEGYSGSEYKLNSARKGDKGYITTTFEVYKYDDAGFIKNYISALESSGFSLAKTSSGSSTIYFLNYSGSESVTHQLIEFSDSKYDMEILCKKDSSRSYISIDHPAEVGFVESSENAKRDYSSVEVASRRFVQSDGDTEYKLSGWGDGKDSVTVSFNPQKYKMGDTITAEDFKTQFKAGSSSALCWINGSSNTISGDGTWSSIGPEKLGDAEVTIMKQDAEVEVVYFRLSFSRGSVNYVIEALEAAKLADTTSGTGGGTGGGGTGGSSPLPFPTLDNICTYCKGTGEIVCSVCRGSGVEMCPNCNGTGSYYERGTGTNPGSVKRCTRCNGNGKIKCSNSRCINGMERCSFCGGTGHR